MEPTTLLDEVRGFLGELKREWPDLFAPRPRRPSPPRPAREPEPAPVLDPPPADDEAAALFRARAAHWAPLLGVTFGRIRVKGQKTLWGSCNPAGDLNFNRRLTMAPPEVLDYVVIHELAHRLEMNHSRRFWAHVEKHCPDHRVHRRWLRKHGEALYKNG